MASLLLQISLNEMTQPLDPVSEKRQTPMSAPKSLAVTIPAAIASN